MSRRFGIADSRAMVLLGCLLAWQAPAAGLRTVVIGDSLSAEYDALPSVPGVDDPTAYAAITVAGWESKCWVEVLGQLRPSAIDFGPYRNSLPGWDDLRFTGYKYNFAIPGFEASQYEDIVNSTLWSHPEYLLFRWTLAGVLHNEADAAVVWIGANELRANYGYLYDGGDPVPLVNGLRHDIGEILDFVIAQNPALKVVVVNLPDLNAAPDKQSGHPDPVGRARVTSATMQANQALSELAVARGMPVADVFSATRRLIEGQTNWLGPVNLHPGSDADNNPRYEFTRDGLHPNTAMQLLIARIIIDAFNERYATSIPQISDGQALGLLGINPQQPYLDWASAYGLTASGMGEDPDQDGLVNLTEFVFNLDPSVKNATPVAINAVVSPPVARYRPDWDRLRLVSITPQWSTNLITWGDVPTSNLSTNVDGWVTARFPSAVQCAFLRLLITMRVIE